MRFALMVALCVAFAAPAVEVKYPQATLRGFPDMSDASGKKLADGKLVQWVEGDKLFAKLEWSFADGRRIVEECEFRQGHQLSQTRWSVEDRYSGEVRRRFEVDFAGKRARGFKLDADGKRATWSEQIDVTPGRTFAGFGVAVAAANLIDRLRAGQVLDLDAVAFMPKPRVSTVRLSIGSSSTLRRGGKAVAVDAVIIHPKVPWPIGKLLGVRDVKLYYFHDDPPQLLRAEEPLIEVKDPVVRIDVLPGGVKLALPQARQNWRR